MMYKSNVITPKVEEWLFFSIWMEFEHLASLFPHHKCQLLRTVLLAKEFLIADITNDSVSTNNVRIRLFMLSFIIKIPQHIIPGLAFDAERTASCFRHFLTTDSVIVSETDGIQQDNC